MGESPRGARPKKKEATSEAREPSTETNAAFAKAHKYQEAVDVVKDKVGRPVGKGKPSETSKTRIRCFFGLLSYKINGVTILRN